MPSIKDFFAGFGWPETIFTLLIIASILFIREWKHIRGLLTGGKEKKKDVHSEE